MEPRKRVVRELAAFLVSGGIAALLNIGTGTIVRVIFGTRGHVAGVAVGFIVGTVVSFWLNREVTFAARRDSLRVQMIRFAILAVTGILLAMAVGEIAFRVAEATMGDAFPPQVLASGAHIVAIGVTTIYNYFGMKFFALRK